MRIECITNEIMIKLSKQLADFLNRRFFNNCLCDINFEIDDYVNNKLYEFNIKDCSIDINENMLKKLKVVSKYYFLPKNTAYAIIIRDLLSTLVEMYICQFGLPCKSRESIKALIFPDDLILEDCWPAPSLLEGMEFIEVIPK